MSDDGLSFTDALKQYNDDVLDDLAHGRLSRYGAMMCGFSPEVIGNPSAPNPIFRWPAPWVWAWCMDCWAPFLDGEVIHPARIVDDVIGARCISCFKTATRSALEATGKAFRGLAVSGESLRATVAMMADALASLGDPLAKIAEFAATEPPAAQCFRCGETTPWDSDIGTPCQRDGCAGRYIKT